MAVKLVFFTLVTIFFFFGLALGGPAYPQNNFNSWDQPYNYNPSPPQQQSQGQSQARRNTNPKSFQTLVREHISEMDKDKQSDLKVLSFFERELNKIFSCYIKLSCSRMRSAKVRAECDEIKDWPLYHQVMSMAGIQKYPYQNFAPAQKRVEELSPSSIVVEESGTGSDPNANANANANDDDDDGEEMEIIEQPRPAQRQNQRRRIRRQQLHH